MKKFILSALFVWQISLCLGQLTVEECYEMARENYPLVKEYGLIALAEEYDLRNASRSYLPQFSLSARATYQTDVTSIPIDIPGYDIPSLDKDQYQILAELSQAVWDGGAAKASKQAVRAQGDVDRAQFEVEMYALRDRIDNIFFGILLIDEQIRLNDLYLHDLQVSYDRIVSYMENGVANQADLDAVRVEQLTTGQNTTQLRANRAAYLMMLSAFIGRPVGEGTVLVKPDIYTELMRARVNNRPELDLYDAMERQIEARRLSINASNMPQLGLFVQGGYGKPGLDMFRQDFKTYAIGGVQLSWNLGNYYTRRNNLRKIDNGIRQVEVQREVFLFNNRLQQTQLDAEYVKYRQVMQDDDEIIRMRENIVRASQAKFDNGIISSTDLVRELIARQNAMVNKAIHEIELIQTVYGIKNLTNN